MPKQQYGEVRVKEMTFSRADINQILLENIVQRPGEKYNFDFRQPFILWNDAGTACVFRFVTTDLTSKETMREISFAAFEEIKTK